MLPHVRECFARLLKSLSGAIELDKGFIYLELGSGPGLYWLRYLWSEVLGCPGRIILGCAFWSGSGLGLVFHFCHNLKPCLISHRFSLRIFC